MFRLKILPQTKKDLEIANFGDVEPSELSEKRVTAGLTVLGRGSISLTQSDEAHTSIPASCPNAPGVYGMLDSAGNVLYVGKSKNLRSRLSKYVCSRALEHKEARVKYQAQQLLWEELPDEFGSLVREIELIDLLKPKLNIRDNPNRRSGAYLSITKDPLPHFTLSRSRPYNGIEAAGPIFPFKEMREAVHRLNDFFQLIDCPQPTRVYFQDEAPKNQVPGPGCMRADIQKCCAPCKGMGSRNVYDARVCSAQRFFYTSKDINKQIKQRVESAIQRLAFEEAMELDRVKKLFSKVRRSIDVISRRRTELSFVYIPKSRNGCEHWYIINRAAVERIVPAPRNGDELATITAVIRECRQTAAGQRAPLRETASTTEAWFKRNPSELQRTKSFEEVLCSSGKNF